jgi:hypothetical protein
MYIKSNECILNERMSELRNPVVFQSRHIFTLVQTVLDLPAIHLFIHLAVASPLLIHIEHEAN